MIKKKSQLVCQHLENISRVALESHQDIIKAYVKGKHGIYALFSKGKLYYVGLASNLRNRLRIHLRDRHANTWDRFSIYLTVNNEHLRDLEALVLKIAMPKGNKLSGAFVFSQDIMASFKRDIESKQRKEVDHLLGHKRPTTSIPKRKTSKSSRQPVLAEYVTKPLKLRLTYKGKLYTATVNKNGPILFKGTIYNSPSTAAEGIRKGGANGWSCWKYEHTPGEWVRLDNLRKK